MTREEARQRRRERNSSGLDKSWQKWVRCQLCRKPYCCNNYPDRKPRTKRLLGVPCCPTCYYLARPAIKTLVEKGLLKAYRKKSSD